MVNQLKLSHSPYLLQHKDNPVHWQMWNQETLNLARVENKIILVSIGYSTCHWCHVMAHECFEDENIASIMNKYFINIKIDREERPDLDHYIMNAVQLMGVSGGWPLHCFLTPDLKPFYGGTYFPPISKYGRMAWPDLLVAIHRSYQEKKEEIIMQSIKLSKAIEEASIKDPIETAILDSILTKSITQLEQYFDLEKGGFGFGQKFPNTMFLLHLMRINDHQKSTTYSAFIEKSILAMCMNGMYDHIQGAFFRYTVDRDWKIPHFEKMGYDHALILGLLSEQYARTKETLYLYFIENSFNFWEREMRSSSGLFYAALDADSEGEEGLYYLWDKEEFEANIVDAEIQNYIEFAPMENKFVLNFSLLNKTTNSAKNELLKSWKNSFLNLAKHRSRRIRPSTDTKCILSWNALIATAYATSYLNTKNLDYKVQAISLLDLILEKFRIAQSEYIFSRIWTESKVQIGAAFLDDYAYLAEACFNVYQISSESKYLDHCNQIIQSIEQVFEKRNGIFAYTNSLHVDTISKQFDLQDSSIPNPNAIIARLYYYQYLIQTDFSKLNKYQEMIRSANHFMAENYFSFISWLSIQEILMEEIFQIKVSSVKDAFYYGSAMNSKNFIYIYTDEVKEGEIYLCTNQICYPKVNSLEELKKLLGYKS